MKQQVAATPEWANHQDPVQASVQFVIQWLAYLYPNCESSVDAAIKQSQPFVDEELKGFWADFLEKEPLGAHLEALAWAGNQIDTKQAPYLIRASWYLLLQQHQLPTLVPSAMRILEQVLGFSESELIRIGQKVRDEVHADIHVGVFQLESSQPDYVYQLEQTLLQESKRIHGLAKGTYSDKSLALSFVTGILVGAALLWTYQYYSAPKVMELASTAPSGEMQPLTSADKPLPVEEVAFPQIIETQPATEVQIVEEASEPEPAPASAPEPQPEVQKPKAKLMEVTANVLNLRVSPDSGSEVIARLGKGAKIWQVGLSEDRRWARVQAGDLEGYVGSFFLKAADPNSDVEPVILQ